MKSLPTIVLRLVLALVISQMLLSSASGYSPDHPKVREMIEKAKSYLAKSKHNLPGGKALGALVFVKDDEPDHPKVIEAIAACEQYASKSVDELSNVNTSYELSLIIIFLSELDPDKYRATIDKLLEATWKRQKPHGGFGYTSKPTGDTSMTQYVAVSYTHLTLPTICSV